MCIRWINETSRQRTLLRRWSVVKKAVKMMTLHTCSMQWFGKWPMVLDNCNLWPGLSQDQRFNQPAVIRVKVWMWRECLSSYWNCVCIKQRSFPRGRASVVLHPTKMTSLWMGRAARITGAWVFNCLLALIEQRHDSWAKNDNLLTTEVHLF